LAPAGKRKLAPPLPAIGGAAVDEDLAASGRPRPPLPLPANQAPPPTKSTAGEGGGVVEAPDLRRLGAFSTPCSPRGPLSSQSLLHLRVLRHDLQLLLAVRKPRRRRAAPPCFTAWKSRWRRAASPCVDARKRPRRRAEEMKGVAAAAARPSSWAATVVDLLRAAARLCAGDEGGEMEVARSGEAMGGGATGRAGGGGAG
jgi:hypothetical protein